MSDLPTGPAARAHIESFMPWLLPECRHRLLPISPAERISPATLPAAVREMENQLAATLNHPQADEAGKNAASALQGRLPQAIENARRLAAENRHQLQRSLGIPISDSIAGNVWFEALIRSRTVSGAPNSATLVAVRRIQ